MKPECKTHRHPVRTEMLTLALVVFSLLPALASAQRRGATLGAETVFNLGSLNRADDRYLLGLKLNPGYNFNDRFSLFAEFTLDLALRSDDHDYASEGALGLAAEYAFLLRKSATLSARLTGGHSLGAERWRYRYLDAGLRYRHGRLKYAPVAGLGVRWYGTSSEGFQSTCSVYLSVGFRIDWAARHSRRTSCGRPHEALP